MRRLAIAALALSLTVPAFALAAEPPPEAATGLEIAKAALRTQKVTFRKVKVGADGKVCGTVGAGADRDMEFMVDVEAQTLWVNEGPNEEASLFTYDPKVKRSTERADYKLWKACQSGK